MSDIPGPNLEEEADKERVSETATVYRVIPKEFLSDVLKNGVYIRTNKMGEKAAELETMFRKVADSRGIKLDRTACTFAFPKNPRDGQSGMGFDPEKDAVIEMRIDPKAALVTDLGIYTEASINFTDGHLDWAKTYIEQYWDDAVPLSDYLSEHANDDEDTYVGSPEVLIPSDISPENIKEA